MSNVAIIAGWLPAIIFPTATWTQLHKVYKDGVVGVSAFTWTLFALANFGAYVFAEKYFSIQAILGFLVTGMLDLLIVIKVLSSAREVSE